MPILAGDLNRRVTIERNMGEARDGLGNVVADWQPIARVWAAVRPLGGAKPVIADAINAETSHIVTIRWRSGMSALTHRLKMNNPNGTIVILDIRSCINNETANEALILQCSEQLQQTPQYVG